MMNLKLIPFEDRIDKECVFCEATQSVKYSFDIMDDTNSVFEKPSSSISVVAFCCNICATRNREELKSAAFNQLKARVAAEEDTRFRNAVKNFLFGTSKGETS